MRILSDKSKKMAFQSLKDNPEMNTALSAWLASTNIAEFMTSKSDKENLKKIGKLVVDDFEVDKETRSEWEDKMDEYLKLAAQVIEHKTFPWQNSANVKYPLLTVATVQFNARAYKNLVPNANIVKGIVIGEDTTGEKAAKARRISSHMSYQCLYEMDDWEDELDKLLMILPICGNAFKKTYNCNGKNKSDLVMPQDLVVNFYAKNLESANRVSHIIPMYTNDIQRAINTGEFLDFKIPKPATGREATKGTKITSEEESHGLVEPSYDDDAPILFIEQHRWLDLDDDGYKEPYVVTVVKETGYVVRIVCRYDADGVFLDERGNVVYIEPVNYFTNFVFIKDPVSGIYGIGLGALLGPINESVNTITNQLIDAGTLANLQSGFLARGGRPIAGIQPLRPGEWRYVNALGDDLRKSLVPIPSKEPSSVLFNLLGMLIQAGQNIASVTDVMLGENPGQNQPYSTTAAVLEQGMVVYSAIYKRLYRALSSELRKLYRLNRLYLPEETYFMVLDSQEQGTTGRTDYDDSIDVIPSSDPYMVADAQKLAKAEALMQLINLGTVNVAEATKRILEAQNQEGIENLMNVPPPSPSIEQQIKLKELEQSSQMEMLRVEIEKFKAASQAARDEAASLLNMAKAQAEGQKGQLEQMKAQYDLMMKEMDMKLQVLKTETEVVKIEAMKQKSEMDARQASTKKYDPKTKKIS